MVRAFYNDLIWLRTDTRKKLYSEDFYRELGDFNPFEVVKPIYESGNAHDPLSRALYTDINFYMTDNCLVKVDRMSMAHSLEVRSPLLDYKLMEFAATLPFRLKISHRKGKALLRRAAECRSIPEILKQPKRGFSIPAARWLRNELRPLAEQTFLGRHSFSGRFLKKNRLKTVWKEHLSGATRSQRFPMGIVDARALVRCASGPVGLHLQGPEKQKKR